MTTLDYERIFSEWKIFSEAEKWSIKSLFESRVNKKTAESFSKFLQQEYNKPAPKGR